MTHMPYATSSAYGEMRPHYERAMELANAVSPDTELDLSVEPLFGDHSARRFGDTVARHTMGETGATDTDIDLTFGWQERYYSTKMQVHYESKFTRWRRAAVTMLA